MDKLEVFCKESTYENFKKIPKYIRYLLVSEGKDKKLLQEYHSKYSEENSLKFLIKACNLLLTNEFTRISKYIYPRIKFFIGHDKTPSYINRRIKEKEFNIMINSQHVVSSELIIGEKDIAQELRDYLAGFYIREIFVQLNDHNIEEFYNKDYGYIWNKRELFLQFQKKETKKLRKIFPKIPEVQIKERESSESEENMNHLSIFLLFGSKKIDDNLIQKIKNISSSIEDFNYIKIMKREIENSTFLYIENGLSHFQKDIFDRSLILENPALFNDQYNKIYDELVSYEGKHVELKSDSYLNILIRNLKNVFGDYIEDNPKIFFMRNKQLNYKGNMFVIKLGYKNLFSLKNNNKAVFEYGINHGDMFFVSTGMNDTISLEY